MFKKILIANRGEIAIRVNRAAHELGVETVAIYSEADRASLHVRNADSAFCVGPGAVARSYLNIPNIISAALISGADAIHPGYGFLAENARFAEICADHGLAFIGPAPSTIAEMGDKATARAIMAAAHVPTTPGSDILATLADALAAANDIGYPVMLKATAGGGGKGMRAVRTAPGLEHAFATAQAEAEANFKDGRLYMERLIDRPRHIEVQVMGDAFGNVVHVGERDCSVQKPSHQKLIEEAPAPHLAEHVREKLYATAVAAARAVAYRSAGTLEFLVSGDEVYFMEMNTRIQVEHPVTEMLYGVDLVREQIRIAAGEPLSFRQDELVPRGHALECRINAEGDDFAPAAGTLTDVALPGGFGVRVDSHAYTNLVVPPFYDSLLAKIVTHGATRTEAIDRMLAALGDTRIAGVKTTLAICAAVLRDETFRAGGAGIDYLPAFVSTLGATVPGMTRRFARELALQTLYNVEIGHNEAAEALAQTFGEHTQAGDQRGFVKELVIGTLENVAQSDEVIGPLLEGWTIDRLPTIDRIVLRMSVYELHHHSETPAAVVLNEAIELAKKYSTDDSGRFVNGVLSSAIRRAG